VLAPHAYGASALLRALASFPLVTPVVHANRPVQTVGVDDVAQAVCMAVDGRLPTGTDVVLAEPQSHRLSDVVVSMRSWLGLSLRPVVAVPAGAARAVSRLADAAGYLGWRSPLRSTAIKAATEGVIGDAGEWTRITGLTCRSLQETLDLMPATVQERWFSRLYLLKPVIVVPLALFWLVSGAVALFRVDVAAVTLVGAGVSLVPAKGAVITGALADIGVGFACLHRHTHERALYGMIGLTLLYLLAASYLMPAQWADPLGPLVKVIPAAVLALVALAISPER
jgi:DoxX-like protein